MNIKLNNDSEDREDREESVEDETEGNEMKAAEETVA